MVKLVISDLDGTLLNDNGKLNSDFFVLVEEMKKKNILFAVATGRQVPNVKKLFEPVLNDIVLIAENGAYISYQEKEIFTSPIPKDQIKKLITCAKEIPDSAIFMCTKTGGYLDNNSDTMNKIADFYGIIYEYTENIEKVEDDILKFTVCDFINTKKNALPILKEKFSDVLEVEASGEVWLDITNPNINKGSAVEIIQKKFGISPNETLAVGDNDNDVTMMEKVFYSFAMKESSDRLRNVTKFSIGSNSEDSVLKLIRSIIDDKLELQNID